jgi:hypothetical protein
MLLFVVVDVITLSSAACDDRAPSWWSSAQRPGFAASSTTTAGSDVPTRGTSVRDAAIAALNAPGCVSKVCRVVFGDARVQASGNRPSVLTGAGSHAASVVSVV